MYHNLPKLPILPLLISCVVLSTPVAADNLQAVGGKTTQTDQTASLAKQALLSEKNKQVVNEAKEALADTQLALSALVKNDPKRALESLRSASGKLDIVLAKKPALALIPADVDITIMDFNGDAKAIEAQIDNADDLLDDGDIQDAKQALSELVSELRVSTTSIPLGSFPTAIKNAIALIDTGKSDLAADVLKDVLGSLETTIEIMPLPILRAEGLLTAASELEHRQDLTQKANREEILKLTESAKDQVTIAELLGYGKKDDYKTLYTAIDEIKETIHSESSAATWAKIKQSFSDFKSKLIHPKNN